MNPRQPLRLALSFLVLHAPFLAEANPEFHPPSVVKQVEALGPTDAFTETERILFLDTEEFHPIPKPGSIDWLSSHRETGQTVPQFLAEKYIRPDKESFLYLQPVGANDLPPEFQQLLADYCKAFFDTEVKMLEAVPVDPQKIASRTNRFTGKSQMNAADILKILETNKPKDAYAVIAFTTTDLYPHETWNFVFGLANLRESVGVFSFARYGSLSEGKQRYTERALKVMSHEIGHMYGMKHCIYWHCLMNGSNHLGETDAAPMRLCPICLRKLDLAIKPDHLTRYSRLRSIYAEQGLERSADFTRTRIQKILESSL